MATLLYVRPQQVLNKKIGREREKLIIELYSLIKRECLWSLTNSLMHETRLWAVRSVWQYRCVTLARPRGVVTSQPRFQIKVSLAEPPSPPFQPFNLSFLLLLLLSTVQLVTHEIKAWSKYGKFNIRFFGMMLMKIVNEFMSCPYMLQKCRQ